MLSLFLLRSLKSSLILTTFFSGFIQSKMKSSFPSGFHQLHSCSRILMMLSSILVHIAVAWKLTVLKEKISALLKMQNILEKAKNGFGLLNVKKGKLSFGQPDTNSIFDPNQNLEVKL